MAVKNTPQRIARHSGVKIPACRFALRGGPWGLRLARTGPNQVKLGARTFYGPGNFASQVMKAQDRKKTLATFSGFAALQLFASLPARQMATVVACRWGYLRR
ncbi:hypothetical protein HMPREF0004_2160 [Achromobacter piechaudii ATCC 43553]|uniref:Uncharacterized protein n=1 Tax=Achromobacter piechaudii ATCC 43553 TaxID=742159 RepID=D4X9L3_9BURK|nr:hypothetical protein HMPREF0004_2160 [Achromobacter piechaudii ATCC 43553]